MAKKYLDISVYEAARERIKYIFDEFENVLVAFSGGKDSAVCMNLVYDYAKEIGALDKVAMYHLDYEAQYQMTTDFVEDSFSAFEGVRKYWLCLPVGADCGVRMDSGTWIPWEPCKRDIWVREMPENDAVVNIDNCPFEMSIGEQDYQVQDKFSKWFADKHGKTAVVIGIRTDESYNRFRAIKSDKKVNPYKGKNYITRYSDCNNCYKAYPIYDWNVEDIWIYNAKFEKVYNKLYDLYYQAGLSIKQMRVANPFHSCGTDTLKLYRVIDPNNWGKMVGRVNGVNFTCIYGGTTAMGWKSITKPAHFTWKEYCYFLLNTLDDETRAHYEEKLNTSIEFWRKKGGVLEDETIDELTAEDAAFIDRGRTSKVSEKRVISFEDYPDDTAATKFKDVPTYKRMCICIIKNDYYCKYMGFAQTKKEAAKRKKAMALYKNL